MCRYIAAFTHHDRCRALAGLSLASKPTMDSVLELQTVSQQVHAVDGKVDGLAIKVDQILATLARWEAQAVPILVSYIGPAAATPCVNHGSTLPVNHLNAPPANVLNENVVVPDAVSATCENKDVLSENVVVLDAASATCGNEDVLFENDVIQDAASDTGENQDVLSENVVVSPGTGKHYKKNHRRRLKQRSFVTQVASDGLENSHSCSWQGV